MVGSKRHRNKSPEIRQAVIASKRLKGEDLTLEEKRAEEADTVKLVLKKREGEMLHIKDWLERFKEKASSKKFKKLGGMFCDGIILPRLACLFEKYNQYEAFLRQHGLQV